jgi:hypothetical protein
VSFPDIFEKAWVDACHRVAVDRLVGILRVVVPLAAAAQAGRCVCRRAIPRERVGWANPTCYACLPEDEADAWRRDKEEHEARAVVGLEWEVRPAPWERARAERRGARKRS